MYWKHRIFASCIIYYGQFSPLWPLGATVSHLWTVICLYHRPLQQTNWTHLCGALQREKPSSQVLSCIKTDCQMTAETKSNIYLFMNNLACSKLQWAQGTVWVSVHTDRSVVISVLLLSSLFKIKSRICAVKKILTASLHDEYLWQIICYLWFQTHWLDNQLHVLCKANYTWRVCGKLMHKYYLTCCEKTFE